MVIKVLLNNVNRALVLSYMLNTSICYKVSHVVDNNVLICAAQTSPIDLISRTCEAMCTCSVFLEMFWLSLC